MISLQKPQITSTSGKENIGAKYVIQQAAISALSHVLNSICEDNNPPCPNLAVPCAVCWFPAFECRSLCHPPFLLHILRPSWNILFSFFCQAPCYELNSCVASNSTLTMDHSLPRKHKHVGVGPLERD